MINFYVMCMCCTDVFFFKRKTAYDMLISDWSSDVCSSDLGLHELEPVAPRHREGLVDMLAAPDGVVEAARRSALDVAALLVVQHAQALGDLDQIGRASCRARVCQYV